ncbi:hypothetical protein SEA_MORGANA_126 [Gordonia phage Morgana]|uniref:Helix-turn-helix DNA binding domain protein n=1 Tax=Gordonia phage Morgana TaxID=3137292 RepID=A0AAX4RD26_9CAUD
MTTATDPKDHGVFVKTTESKRGRWLSPNGLNGLRIHALRYTEADAHRVAKSIIDDPRNRQVRGAEARPLR